MGKALAAIALAIAVVASGCGGDDEEAAEQPTEPAEAIGAPAGTPLEFLTAAPTRMTSDGCSAEVSFTWEAIDRASVPAGAEAVIKVKGPRIAGSYERRFDDAGRVTLKLSARVNRPTTEWTGMLVSVEGEAVIAPPTTHPFLNTACGDGQPTPPSSLPPGTPVQGAPCVPGQPLPPGFECKRG